MNRLICIFCLFGMTGFMHGLSAQTNAGNYDEDYSPYTHNDAQNFTYENDSGYLHHRHSGGLDDFDQRGSFETFDRHGHETDFYFNQTGDIEYIFR